MLARIADLFEVSVSDLLGQNVPTPEPSSGENEVAKQLAILNEQLARQTKRNKKLLKCFLICVLVAAAAVVMLMLLSYSAPHSHRETPAAELSTATLTCTLEGEEYLYEITYDSQYRIVKAGGDEWIADHVLAEQYDDANVLIAQIQDYFTLRGGTCELSGEIP